MKLSFAYHVDQFDASQERLCPSKRFEAQHGSNPSYDVAVILFNQIIQILVLPDSNELFFWSVGIERGQRCRVGTTFINGYYVRLSVLSNGLAKEAKRRCGIPFNGQQEVDGVTCRIDRTVEIFPFAFDSDVGFVHEPPTDNPRYVYASGRPFPTPAPDGEFIGEEWNGQQ